MMSELIERLRAAGLSMPDSRECGLDGNVCDEAADEIERKDAEIAELKAYIAKVEAWQAEGEKVFERAHIAVLFWLGGWWADRPWRNRE